MTVTYDVIIIGAGIHGAGIAQAASARGWSVLVVEKTDAADGTSSKSSKLIHGGLRYLETLQIKLVNECLRERSILLRNAPDLVQLKPFYIPVYRSSRRSGWWIRAGLSLYALLGGLGEAARFEKIPKRDWSRLQGLNTDGLVSVYRYNDAQTDDAALTRAVLRSARSLGAEYVNNAEVEEVEREGAFYAVRLAGRQQRVRCRALVNAAGPWVNKVAARVRPEVEQLPVDLVQGTHLVLDFPAPEGCYYLESPDDGRAVFALPWKGKLMVGTTEISCGKEPEACGTRDEEIQYLLRVYNVFFQRPGGGEATEADIVERTAGLRVLPAPSPKAAIASKRSRETLYVTAGDEPFYLAVYGGKLTSYRATSERVADRLAAHLPKKPRVAQTDELPLV